MAFELFFAFVVAALLLSIVVQVQDSLGRRRQARVTHEPQRWPWVRYVFLGLIPAAILAGWSYDTVFGRRYRVADWLNLSGPPRSMWVVDCEHALLLTDVSSNCVITLNSRDFGKLLGGYRFQHYKWDGNDGYVNLATGQRHFDVSDYYVTTPPEFEHGGEVTVYTNAARTMAIVDLYVE
ncbi:MAG: hypothetical protein U1F30_08945 [Steroidobacteraceae bacterium]